MSVHTQPRQRMILTNGIRMQVTEQGSGPLVVLCHGWPETWHCWRHVLPAIAAAGFHAVAPDLRGYGGTDVPEAIEAYDILQLVGDVVGLITALGAERAVIVGHDWGATLAWNAALMRPDLFRGIAALSVPYRPRAGVRPLQALRDQGLSTFYWLYFQKPGHAEREFEGDPFDALQRLYYSVSGDALPEHRLQLILKPDGRFLDGTALPARPLAWLTQDDLSVAVAAFRRTGFRGGLNWYRNIDRNWELTAPWHGARIALPALFIAGTADPVIAGATGKEAVARLPSTVPQLQQSLLVDGAGHWIQQERPAEVNAALLRFLARLPQ